MNKKIFSHNVKRFLYNLFLILFYLLIIIILPIKYAEFLFKDNGSLIFLYLLVIPLLFLFPVYKLAKLDDIKERCIFIIFGMFFPLLFLYLFIFFEIQKGFNLSF